MTVQIQLRRDTAANWTSEDPTLAEGELGIDLDTGRFKIGDGSTAWTSLAFAETSTQLLGLLFISDTSSQADSDPGAGLFRWNHATQSSATELFFNDGTVDAIDVSALFDAMGADGTLYLQQYDDSSKWQLWQVNSVTTSSDYVALDVTLLAYGGAIASSKVVLCDFKTGGAAINDPTGRHAIWIAAAAITPSAAGGCAALATIASAANQPDIQTLDFDATTQEYAQFSITMPESWDEGTVTFEPVWSHAATTTNFGVVWDLQAVAVSNDDAIATAFGTAQTSTDTGGTTNDLYKGPESSAITVGGSPASGDTVFFRLSRVTGNGSDTMAVDARLHGITLYITTNAGNDA